MKENVIVDKTYSEFIAKIQIAFKEARETKYWLRLIKDADVYQNAHSE